MRHLRYKSRGMKAKKVLSASVFNIAKKNFSLSPLEMWERKLIN